MEEVYIVSAARTPIGSFNGTLSKIKSSELGSIVIKEVIKRAKVENEKVNEVIMGQVLNCGQGQNPARQASLKAGLPVEVPAYGINLLCGSGLKSVVLGYQAIKLREANIIVAGGQENMSMAPHFMHMRESLKMGTGKFLDSMVQDGLIDAMYDIHMGVTAENVATKFNINRASQDIYALSSQHLSEKAQELGHFDKEIVPVEVTDRQGTILFDKDEYIKVGCTMAMLEKCKPAFKTDGTGTVTAGNASGINDAAAAVLLMSGDEVKRRHIKPLAKIVAWAQAGIDPKVMGIAPVTAVEAVLAKCGWSKDDVDLYELNEAFAAQALAVMLQLKLNAAKVNVNGGAIALGHPIGASGSRILVTLLYALKRTGGRRGVASLCIGGGMGIAMAIECLNETN